MTEGMIFDYGGTIDSRGDHWSEVIFDQYKALDLPVSYEQFRNAYIEGERALARRRIILPMHNFRDVMLHKMMVQIGYLKAQGALKGYDTDVVATTIAARCYEEAREAVAEARVVLEYLAEHMPLALVSNFYGNISSVLADFDLLRFFPTIVESSVVGVRKPDPRIFTLGIEALGMAAEDVLVVGDSIGKDLIPAASLGCRTAWVNGPGWDDGGKTPLSPPEGAAKLASLSDLLHLLK